MGNVHVGVLGFLCPFMFCVFVCTIVLTVEEATVVLWLVRAFSLASVVSVSHVIRIETVQLCCQQATSTQDIQSS